MGNQGRIFRVLLIASLLLGSLPARAAGTGGFNLGLLLGMAFPSSSSSAFTWGLTSTYKFGASFGATVYFYKFGMTVNSASGSNTIAAETAHTFYGPQFDYFFPASFFRTGFRLGMSKSEITSSATNGTTTINVADSHSNIVFGPLLGFDYPVGVVSVGGELSYLLGMGDNPPTGISAVGTVKYWF